MATESRAFDTHHPPDLDIIQDCVHCGFCLPTCPTYALWGEEMDSPRGRIVLMRTGLEAGSEMAPGMVTHFDRCLGCMACVTACPSGVRYDRLIEQTRPQVERHFNRTLTERAMRRAIFASFAHPGRMRAMVPLLAAARALKLDRAVARLPVDGRWGRIKALADLAPKVPARAAWTRLEPSIPARGTRRGTVALLQGCVQRAFFGDVNQATASVLAAEGFDVLAPKAPSCCGALMLHTGYEEEAKQLASNAIGVFEGADHVITNAAGCGSAMKDYRHLFAGDPTWETRAAELSDRVRDVTEFLAEVEPTAPRHRLPLKLAYHDACHLAHAQGVRSQPRSLLAGIPGVELVEPEEWELCCGSAGIYNLLQPDAAKELGARKARNLIDTNADAIAAGNPGCTLQITAALTEAGKPLPVYHPIQLLDASISKRRL